MKLKYALLTIFTIFCIANIGVAFENVTGNVTVIKELPTKEVLENFTATLTKTANFTGIASQETTVAQPTWPHDIWRDKRGTEYLSFYYLNNSHPSGYTSIYYDDSGNRLPSTCKLSLWLVEPYYGMNITSDENIELPENVTVKVLSNDSIPEAIEEPYGVIVLEENETGQITSQGNNNSNSQYWFDISNLKDCVINFCSSNAGGHYTP